MREGKDPELLNVSVGLRHSFVISSPNTIVCIRFHDLNNYHANIPQNFIKPQKNHIFNAKKVKNLF